MKLKNAIACLITVNGKLDADSGQRVESYKLLPAGPAVDVPDALAKSRYVRALIEKGDVTVVDAGASEPAQDDEPTEPAQDDEGVYAGMSDADLFDYAQSRGDIKVDKRMKRGTIIKLLEDADA